MPSQVADDDGQSIKEIGDPNQAGPKAITKSIHQKQEDVRRWLALALVVIFAIEVLGAMAALWLCHAPSVENIKDILTVILGPTVALVGSATGFYFGSKTDTQTPPK